MSHRESIKSIIKTCSENSKACDPRTLAGDRQEEFSSFFESAEGFHFVLGLPPAKRIPVYILMSCSSGDKALKLLWEYHGKEHKHSSPKLILEKLIDRQSIKSGSQDIRSSDAGGRDDQAPNIGRTDGWAEKDETYTIEQLIRLHVMNPDDSSATIQIIRREEEFVANIRVGTAVDLIIGLPLIDRIRIYSMIPIWSRAQVPFVLWRLIHAEQDGSAIALLEKMLGRPA
jgi:hypothetical protein